MGPSSAQPSKSCGRNATGSGNLYVLRCVHVNVSYRVLHQAPHGVHHHGSGVPVGQRPPVIKVGVEHDACAMLQRGKHVDKLFVPQGRAVKRDGGRGQRCSTQGFTRARACAGQRRAGGRRKFEDGQELWLNVQQRCPLQADSSAVPAEHCVGRRGARWCGGRHLIGALAMLQRR